MDRMSRFTSHDSSTRTRAVVCAQLPGPIWQEHLISMQVHIYKTILVKVGVISVHCD